MVPEFHVHVTVPPVCTTVSRGVKEKSLTLTPTAVGGANPISVNVTADWMPEKLALTVWVVEGRPARRSGYLTFWLDRLTLDRGSPAPA